MPTFNTTKILGDLKVTGTISADTINGNTHGDPILRQLSGGRIAIGSTTRDLRLMGIGSRPFYTKNESGLGTELALLSDITDTKNTAGANNTSEKIFLVGATSQEENPQTYSDADVFTTGGLLTAKALGVSNTTYNSGTGLSLYAGPSSGQPEYGMMFAGTGTFGTYGTVTADWATYFTMSTNANRGWIFKAGSGSSGNVASINTEGAARFASTVEGTQLKSNVAIGTAPLTVKSTTVVTNLNADRLDGYHASSLWRSDGGTWDPGANIKLNQTANGQEWSFDITRNGYTGGHWHVYDSVNSTMLKVDAVTGKVSAPYNFVGNLEGNANSATNADLLDGLHLNSTTTNNEANKVVRTDASGYANFGWINTTSGNTDSAVTDVYVNTNDGYIRKKTLAKFKAELGIGGGPTLIRQRSGSNSLTSASSSIPVPGVAQYDTIMMEVNKYSGASYNPKIVTVTLGKNTSAASTDSDHICSWSTWNGTTERINSFNVAISASTLYFTDFKYVERSVSGSNMNYSSGPYTLYVGRIWKL